MKHTLVQSDEHCRTRKFMQKIEYTTVAEVSEVLHYNLFRLPDSTH